jgi:hypothetical protein
VVFYHGQNVKMFFHNNRILVFFFQGLRTLKVTALALFICRRGSLKTACAAYAYFIYLIHAVTLSRLTVCVCVCVCVCVYVCMYVCVMTDVPSVYDLRITSSVKLNTPDIKCALTRANS